MKFLSVRSDICRRLPSDSNSRWTPLPLTMQFPLLGLARDFHPSDNAHAERTKQPPHIHTLQICGGFTFSGTWTHYIYCMCELLIIERVRIRVGDLWGIVFIIPVEAARILLGTGWTCGRFIADSRRTCHHALTLYFQQYHCWLDIFLHNFLYFYLLYTIFLPFTIYISPFWGAATLRPIKSK